MQSGEGTGRAQPASGSTPEPPGRRLRIAEDTAVPGGSLQPDSRPAGKRKQAVAFNQGLELTEELKGLEAEVAGERSAAAQRRREARKKPRAQPPKAREGNARLDGSDAEDSRPVRCEGRLTFICIASAPAMAALQLTQVSVSLQAIGNAGIAVRAAAVYQPRCSAASCSGTGYACALQRPTSSERVPTSKLIATGRTCSPKHLGCASGSRQRC